MLLEIDSLMSGYGKKNVLGGVSLNIGDGEIVAVLGHNGAGKSTLMGTAFGIIPTSSGRVMFNGADLTRQRADKRLQAGLGYCPQGAPVFSTMTVEENLLMGSYAIKADEGWRHRMERALKIFPRLDERRTQRAGSLSGGERQMLALAMLFVAGPRLLMLDEPSGGLSPAMVDNTYSAIKEIASQLGAAIMLVEQDVQQALRVADRVYVMANGLIKFEGHPDQLRKPKNFELLIGL